MQAILLCEYFARFRGRKAVTRPSKPFESLCFRVSCLRSSSVPPSSSALAEDNGLWLVDTTAWSPASSPMSSNSSLCDAVTPTSNIMSPIALRHLSPLQTHSWGSFPSSQVRSSAATSPFGNVSFASSYPSLGLGLPTSMGFNLNHNLSASPSTSTSSPSRSRSRTQPSWSSLFAPDYHNPVSATAPFPLTASSSQAPRQAYSLCVSNQQAMYQNPGLLDHAMLAAEQQHLSIQDRWRNWIDTESRRRLLATCIVTDGQAAIYQQQRRAQDGDADAAMQLVPLLGRSSKLWAAASAEEWVSVLAADPEALQPEYVPPLEHLTLEEVAPRPTIDRMIILSALAQRLPRQQRPLSTSSLSANNSPAPEMDPHIGSQFRADHQPPAFLRQNQQPYYQAEPEASFDAEERINALFPACPIANTYLALHHTPLRDLLAVGGDSWVFSQKVLPATSFQEHQRRLKIWVTSCANTGGSSVSAGAALAGLSVVSATIYAARAIVGFLSREQRDHDRPRPLPGSSNSITADVDSALWANDISDYWALYVCALICWAFVHPARAGGAGPDFGQEGGVGSSSSSSISNSEQQQQNSRSAAAVSGIRGDVEIATLLPEAVSVTSTRPGNGAYQPSDNDALAWLRTVASPDVKPENVVRARGRREALGVVGLVRKRLESDCVGGRSRLYVDAVGVLRKLEDGLGWKWF